MKDQMFLGIIVLIGIFIYKQKYPAPLKLVWTAFSLQVWWMAYNPKYIPEFAPHYSNVLAWNASKYLLSLIILPAIIPFINKKLFFRGLFLFCVVNSLYLLWGGRGLMYANTFDAGVMMCMLPLFLKRKDLSLLVTGLVVLTAVVFKSRSAALGGCVIALIYWWEHCPKFTFYKVARALTVISVVLALPFIMFNWIQDARAKIFAHYMGWWWDQANVWIGTGMGSFEWLGATIPSGITYQMYMMHNDWMQLLFEAGIIGFCLVVGLFFWTAYKLRRHTPYLAVWCAYGAVGFVYYPYHSLLVQVLVLIILYEVVKEQPTASLRSSNEPLV
jgi:hypothetical protein